MSAWTSTLVTSNADKLREAKHILQMDIESVSIELDEIQETDAMKISDHKAKQAWDFIKKPVVVWDTSIYIECLNGFPWPLIKWFWNQVWGEKICQIAIDFKNRRVANETILTYYDGEELHHFIGRIEGTIPDAPRGENGWGWDPIFIPEWETETYGEMTREKMTTCRSHTIALGKMKEFLISKN